MLRATPAPYRAEAFAIAGTERVALNAGTPAILAAGAIVLEIHGVARNSHVRLDGRPLRGALSPAGVFTVGVDLRRATGYHRLAVLPDRQYVFGTSDAKLRIEGVVAMLDFLQREAGGPLGLEWSGVMQFTGSQVVVRDRRLDAAWLERNGPVVARIAQDIAQRPFVANRASRVRATHGIPDVPATAALIRRNPELMERFPRGIVQFGGERWMPREVVVRRRERFVDTAGNRRATRLVLATLELVRWCASHAPEDELFSALTSDLTDVLRREPFRSIRRQRTYLRTGSQFAVEERLDPRYKTVRQLLDALISDRHWDPTHEVADETAYAGLADWVYQTFAGLVLASAYELRSTAPLGQTGPHFADDEFELWINASPPSSVLSSWRDSTDRPADLRPDLVLRRREDGEVAILDAKYRTAGARATSDSLSEVQLYLQAYGCSNVSILFPPRSEDATEWSVSRVSDGQFSIAEIPLRPAEGLGAYARDHLRPAVDQTFQRQSPRTGSVEYIGAQQELRAEQVQTAAVRTLIADGAVVQLTQPGAMRSAENNLRRSLGTTWDALSDEVQRMLITAEYFGDQVPDGFDHSGPVLGIFAACERLARERLFDPLRALHPQRFDRMTFGEIGAVLRRVPRGKAPRERLARTWLQQTAVDLSKLASCGATIQKANRWRIAAAHADLVDKETWDNSHRAILQPTGGLLVRLAAALPVGPPT